eukprot:2092081-Prymnesium_polylepis.1
MLLALLLRVCGTVQIANLIADDPDESEVAFAAGDTLLVRFSDATPAPGDAGGLDRSAVDTLLSFSTPIDGDYWAHWNANATELTITFGVVVASSAPAIGGFRASCRASGGLVAGAGASACTGTGPLLAGAWGYGAPSSISILELRAADADDADQAFGVNDTLTVVFNESTNRAGLEEGGTLDSEQVWELLSGDPALLGVLFRGVWNDSATLILTVESVAEHAPEVGSFRVEVRPEARLRDALNATVRSHARSPPLQGDWGRPPAPTLFVAMDPDDGDSVSSTGDVMTLTFDKPTNTPAVSSRRELDRLMEFSQALGDDYS